MNHAVLRATLVAQRAAIDASIAQLDADASKMTGKSPASRHGTRRHDRIQDHRGRRQDVGQAGGVITEKGSDMSKQLEHGLNTEMAEAHDLPLVVVQRVWVQTSSDYNAVERTRTLVVTPSTTVGEVMRWAAAANVLGRGDVVLTEQDYAV